MAQEQQQIDPLDLTPSTGVGVSLPFNGPGVFNTNYTTEDQTQSNLNGKSNSIQIGIGSIDNRGPAPYEQVNN